MKIQKQAAGGGVAAPTDADLEQIEALARRKLTREELYTFSVRLCDNEIDRDFERFTAQTLEELAALFVGKSGIFDHRWSAMGQTARIYKTQVVREPGRTTGAGDEYCWLKGWAYMMRTEHTRDLIAEIEGGIKKEVSVGCAVDRSVCSICGADRSQAGCGHQKGQEYDGQLCYASLEGAKDAYEFSFVAVPAQPMAGVVKCAGPDRRDSRETGRLEQEAALGRRYLEGLRSELVRLALLADGELDGRVVKAAAGRLSPGELEALTESFARRAQEKYPVKTQLSYEKRREEPPEGDRAFLV